VLEILLPLIKDVTYDRGRDKSETDREHEHNEDTVGGCRLLLKLHSNWERSGDNVELEVRIASCLL
jgi:hypothetical protein